VKILSTTGSGVIHLDYFQILEPDSDRQLNPDCPLDLLNDIFIFIFLTETAEKLNQVNVQGCAASEPL
jgi:hypothetical protein